jgi:hypothetical protein
MHNGRVRRLVFRCLAVALVLGLPLAAQAGLVNVDLYYGANDTGSGVTFSNFASSFTSSDIMFGTNNSWEWFPLGGIVFGADITGCLNVASSGNHQFTLKSDDGSYLFIDGGPVINNGSDHYPISVSDTVYLAAGTHPFEVQFRENGIMFSGVDLTLPSGVTYGNPVPLPPALLLFGSGLLGLAGWRSFRKS